MEKAVFGAGCFWGPEMAFRQLDGVKGTAVGYCGGTLTNPTYEQVCSGQSGHTEVIEVTFDPHEVSYENLLNAFWANHDPTQVNRQGPDIGEQYRSVIFAQDPAQRAAAEASRQALAESGRHPQPIATAVEDAQPFWKAEEYHQQYLEKRGLFRCH
jgi:peptide-methionine (S)-S-oxide reductase